MDKEITQISYPNTVADIDRYFYEKKLGYEIKRTEKNGEMASIGWFEIYKQGELIAEIKESVCDIYYK